MLPIHKTCRLRRFLEGGVYGHINEYWGKNCCGYLPTVSNPAITGTLSPFTMCNRSSASESVDVPYIIRDPLFTSELASSFQLRFPEPAFASMAWSSLPWRFRRFVISVMRSLMSSLSLTDMSDRVSDSSEDVDDRSEDVSDGSQKRSDRSEDVSEETCLGLKAPRIPNMNSQTLPSAIRLL